MRQFQASPAAAILWLAELMRADLAKDFASNVERMMADARARVEALKGKDGASPRPEDVARIVLSTSSFKAALGVEDGEDAKPEDVAAALKADPAFLEAVRGEPGEPGSVPSAAQVAAELADDPDFAAECEGDDADPAAVAAALASDPSFVAAARGERGSPDQPLEIAAKLNTTEESVDQKVIKDLPRWMRGIETAIRSLGKREKKGGGGKVGGGGSIVEYYDLTALCDGSTKTFAIPSNRRILSVHSTQFPVTYRPGVDWTGSGTRTLTLTSEVGAPQAGQTLYMIYIH